MIYQITYVKDESGQNRKVARLVKDRQELLALRDSPDNLGHLAKAKQGDKAEKAELLQLAYNIGYVDGLLAGCKSIGSFFFYDVDLYGQDSDALKNLILSKKEEIGLMMLERSASGGWHLVCRREKGKTILECIVKTSLTLRLEMDTGAKDLQRVVFSTSGSEDDLVYLDDELFGEPMSREECEAEYQVLKERERKKLEEVPAGAKKANKHYRPWEDSLSKGAEGRTQGTGTSVTSQATPQMSQSPCTTEDSSEIIEVTERTRFIAEGVMKEKGLDASDFVDEGGRHTAVKIFLSGATQLLSKGETNGVLQELMPQHWGDQNIQQLVNDFYQNYTNPSQRLLKYQEELFTKSRRLSTSELSAPQGMLGERPPEMPKKLPKLIKLLTSRTPDAYKPAVANAVFPALGAHLCRVSFKYTDNVVHEATLMNCLMAETGAGKGCIDKPIEFVMKDIKKRDEENEKREKEWKQDYERKGANKDKMLRPEGLVIQTIDPDMTKPALVTRMDEAEGHFVYVKLNELDLFEQLKGKTGKQHFQLMCLAFDPDSEYGQTRYGTQSVTARPKCRFNWNACSTILKGRKFFRNVLTDGPISRINFCTIPEEEIGCDQPIYGIYDLAFEEELKPYIDKLTSARGQIDCQQAFRLAKRLQQECAEFARLSQNRVYWNLSHRACVIAWLKACVLYVANGQQWERSIEDFIIWSLRYDMWCKMVFFGADIERAERGEDSRLGKHGPRNLLELLPEEFTIDDARRVRQQEGLDTDDKKCRHMLSQWVYRNYISQITDHSFKKAS
ncbi:MAG: hypothetical protein IKI13_01200 [Bacteroidales bacterium]|nr:hypothetical protein [Bacteroidales bacterium]